MRRDRFERLYSENAQQLLGFLTYRTGERAVAEDLLADTFERVLRSRRPFDPRRGSEKTWLYSIALNLVRDHHRRKAAEGRAMERIGTPGAAHAPDDEIETKDAVHRALATLSDEEREAIALRFGGEMTVPEVAKLTKEPLTTVEGRVYRALRKLKGELE
jgi:RNA polymerase sigma factor (sigma-70 family)